LLLDDDAMLVDEVVADDVLEELLSASASG
jgi:hypothetical protein